ncbi:hypothetical protein KKD95_01435, partial [Patescibacteria group bacterium]|nr:hypothetical protein [Patescibacteria group bacterium]
RTWLFVPTFVTAAAVVMSLSTVHTIYNGVDLQCAAHEFGCMADEQAAGMYYRSLREKMFLHSWLNAFGDSVVWLQCLWLWLLPPFLIYRKLERRERALA